MNDVLAGKIVAKLLTMQHRIVRLLKRCESRMTMRQKKAVFILLVILAASYCNYILVSALTGTAKKEWLKQLRDTTVHEAQTSHVTIKK